VLFRSTQPRWSHDGKELFYLATDQKLMVVPLHARAFEAATPQLLFQLPTTTDFHYAYDVSADGQRFLVNTLAGEEASTPLTVIIDWNTASR